VSAECFGFPDIVPNGIGFPHVLSHPVPVRMRDLTPEQLFSVPCPTCGVAAGKRCLLHSGALRSESHVDRKLSAAETIEVKRYRRIQSLAKSVTYRAGGRHAIRQTSLGGPYFSAVCAERDGLPCASRRFLLTSLYSSGTVASGYNYS